MGGGATDPSPERPEEHLELLGRIRLVALDVDGVLTNGRVIYTELTETQEFDAKDGIALRWLRECDIEVCWISGRGSGATERRAQELGVKELFTRVRDKEAVLAELQERLRLGEAETLAMGDDLPDLALARRAAFFACPADARPEVRERAQWVTHAPGGRGAVREVVEGLLKAQNAWTSILERYQG